MNIERQLGGKVFRVLTRWTREIGMIVTLQMLNEICSSSDFFLTKSTRHLPLVVVRHVRQIVGPEQEVLVATVTFVAVTFGRFGMGIHVLPVLVAIVKGSWLLTNLAHEFGIMNGSDVVVKFGWQCKRFCDVTLMANDFLF